MHEEESFESRRVSAGKVSAAPCSSNKHDANNPTIFPDHLLIYGKIQRSLSHESPPRATLHRVPGSSADKAEHLCAGKPFVYEFRLLHAQELGLPEDPNVPLLGFIGRLDYQKGVDLIRDNFDWLMHEGAQLVLLGSGRDDLENSLRRGPDSDSEHSDPLFLLCDYYPGTVLGVGSGPRVTPWACLLHFYCQPCQSM